MVHAGEKYLLMEMIQRMDSANSVCPTSSCIVDRTKNFDECHEYSCDTHPVPAPALTPGSRRATATHYYSPPASYISKSPPQLSPHSIANRHADDQCMQSTLEGIRVGRRASHTPKCNEHFSNNYSLYPWSTCTAQHQWSTCWHSAASRKITWNISSPDSFILLEWIK